tara:strand:+ start:353 stop:547 length:195 start_codon:yes stop_codon:yes gene_type:complete
MVFQNRFLFEAAAAIEIETSRDELWSRASPLDRNTPSRFRETVLLSVPFLCGGVVLENGDFFVV